MSDPPDPQESSRERKHEHAEAVEAILDSVDPALEEHAYPVDSEELSARYGETTVELPNETESLGSVFDRLSDDEYDSPLEVKEAVLDAVTGATPARDVAGEDRSPQPGTQGAPQEVLEDLESEAVEAPSAPGTPDDVEAEADDVGTTADTAGGPATDAAEPGDELTPGTTEDGDFAPQETVEDRDRESGGWDAAEGEPGDPAEPTAEPAEAELDEAADDLPPEDEAAASERTAGAAESDAEEAQGAAAESPEDESEGSPAEEG